MSATIVDARQVERGLSSLVEAFRRVARTSDGGWLEERDHVISIACLLLTPLVGTMPPVPRLEVRRVDDAAALAAFNDICAEAFGLDRPILAILDDPEVLEAPGLGFHLGLVDGVAVGTAMTGCIDGVVLIFNVATLPSHRRRGIGEAMTWCAVNHGIEVGCDLAFLEASPDGLPLYERMGFHHAEEMQTWSLA